MAGLTAISTAAADFEVPPTEPAAASLPPELVSGASGSVSPLAREQLTRLGWEVHNHAMESLTASSGPLMLNSSSVEHSR